MDDESECLRLDSHKIDKRVYGSMEFVRAIKISTENIEVIIVSFFYYYVRCRITNFADDT